MITLPEKPALCMDGPGASEVINLVRFDRFSLQPPHRQGLYTTSQLMTTISIDVQLWRNLTNTNGSMKNFNSVPLSYAVDQALERILSSTEPVTDRMKPVYHQRMLHNIEMKNQVSVAQSPKQQVTKSAITISTLKKVQQLVGLRPLDISRSISEDCSVI